MVSFKKVGIFAMAALVCLSLGACKSDGSGNPEKYDDEQVVTPGAATEDPAEKTYVDWSMGDDKGKSKKELDETYRSRARTCVPKVIFIDDTRYQLAVNKLANELAYNCFAELSFQWDDESLYDRELTDEDMRFITDNKINVDNWPEGEYVPDTGLPAKSFLDEYEKTAGSKWEDDMYQLYVAPEKEAAKAGGEG